jgi:hypothetical protein
MHQDERGLHPASADMFGQADDDACEGLVLRQLQSAVSIRSLPQS